ncbi:glycosyltransferase family protein [Flavobacterium phragmitis]|uniref:Uncharacterized protein n=1 Tax=Flavobacterium phragmitis TaxID=739143 RepID=A0A1I1UPK0_9FLAO|nr:hypothetical protein [Flavobacterium phragmitis]SFD72716.1 hypothetical protein SAMN05216297_111120 [Flavobacterium phragmitis]
MEVFVPHLKDRNIYLDEIINFSNCTFIFNDFNSYETTYEIVNIQFPEAIFKWIVPSDEQLIDLEKKILMWKKHSKIIYTLNDIKSHYNENNQYNHLFRLIQKHADGVIHLGEYSLAKYKFLFSQNCIHTVIYHPLYESLIKDFTIDSFQEKYNLDFKNKYIVSVIGEVRSKEEVKFIFEIFKRIPLKNKFLVVPNMLMYNALPTFFPYRFRKVYRKIEEFLFCYPLLKKQYFFGFKFVEYKYMVDLVKQSSLLIIPRTKNLNSGNLYLALSFDKPMIIPKVGNQTEIINLFNFPAINLKTKNYKEVIDSIVINGKPFFKTKDYLEKKEKFMPKNIAAQYDLFFYKLINY